MRRIAFLVLALTLFPAAPSMGAEQRGDDKIVVQAPPKVAPQAASRKRRAVRSPGPATVVAIADAYTVPRGGTLVRAAAQGVLANDTGASLIASVVTTTAHGTLALAADGSFTYVNDSSSATTDSFVYKATSGSAQSQATATITISGPPPQANNDTFPVTQGSPLTITAPGVLANDVVSGATITSYGINGNEQTAIGSATPTAHGSVSLGSTGGFTYNATGGFNGADTFKYTLTNGSGSSIATVTINVVPTPPSATDDGYSTTQNNALNTSAPGVLANDTLNGAAIASYGKTSGVEQTTLGVNTPTLQNGTVSVNADGSFTYTPPNGFTGSDSFKYVLGNAGGSATATVTITVQGGNNTPDFVVTSPGFFYVFSGINGQNPELTLQRGRTYTFQINTSSAHPFEIIGAPQGSVTNNNISNGLLTFAVPSNGTTYAYHCSIHEFGNQINTQ